MHNWQWRPRILFAALMMMNWLMPAQLPSAQAEDKPAAHPQTEATTKTISQKVLQKYKSISITVEQDGKQVTYSGLPLRSLLAEMLPQIKIDSMPEWKALSRQELVMVARGDDGYPGLVTAVEIAINKTGDRFLLATHKDGKLIESGVQLICKGDEARTRWVRNVVSLEVRPTGRVAGNHP